MAALPESEAITVPPPEEEPLVPDEGTPLPPPEGAPAPPAVGAPLAPPVPVPEPAEVPFVYLAPRGPLPPPRKVNAAADLLGTFGLLPLYKEYVRPYLKVRPAPAGVTPPPEEDKTDDRARFPRTWAHFVSDIPGRAGPNKAAARAARRVGTQHDDHAMGGLTASQAAQKADPDAGAFRAILFRPETTIRQPVPLGRDLLDAFRVPVGSAPQPAPDTPQQARAQFIDLDRLLPDDPEEEPRRRRPKRRRDEPHSAAVATKRPRI